MKHYLSLIKFSHTIFALPFALIGFFIATQKSANGFDLKILFLVILCMLFARSAAMAYNRYLDRDIDQLNPRTAKREIPAGVISANAALWFVVVNALLFWACTWFINSMCFLLAPVALLIVLGYSHTKRFTFLCHFVLGLGLALAPTGAYLAVSGRFDVIPVLFSVIVLLWVSGFDIVYALQDEEFDKSLQLQSIPAFLGKTQALKLSSVLHIACAILMLLTGYLLSLEFPSLGLLNWLAVTIFIGLLLYQHLIVSSNDLSRVNLAFFTTNGIASVLFALLFILDLYV
jgi:4-hydroxybenzoate polyprenyltransferase